jgi:plastocyanin
MTRRSMIAGAAALLAATAPAARAADHTVAMPGKLFSPSHLTVVSGDHVVFRNTDFSGAAHDVRAADGFFETGSLARFATYRQRYDALGRHGFLCTIHPGMSGQVEVVAALLEAPQGPVAAGSTFRLSGRARAGTQFVRVERERAGAWEPAGTAVPSPDGSFQVELRADAPAGYRAVTAAGSGLPVVVPVVTGMQLHPTVRRTRRGRVVHVHVVPAVPGTFAVLERYVRERFTWRRRGRVRLSAAGTARFRLRAGARGLARVLVEPRQGEAPLAVGAPLRLRSGLPTRDPVAGDRPAGSPHPPGHG